MRIDRSAWPFVAIAAVPALACWWLWPPYGGAALLFPVAVALFFRDPDRRPPSTPGAVVAPADGRVLYAGPARREESPEGEWLQVTVFLSLLDVHINRAPIAGRVVSVEPRAGGFRAAFRPDAYGNTRTEITLDHHGTPVVFRQIVGVLARRIVCRLAAGDTVQTGARIGLMKFGSRMDVFVPTSATLTVAVGARTVAGETVIARLDGARS